MSFDGVSLCEFAHIFLASSVEFDTGRDRRGISWNSDYSSGCMQREGRGNRDAEFQLRKVIRK